MSEHQQKQSEASGVVVVSTKRFEKLRKRLLPVILIIVLIGAIVLGGYLFYKDHHVSPQQAAVNSTQKQIAATNDPGTKEGLYMQLAMQCAAAHDTTCENQAYQELSSLTSPNSLTVILAKASAAAAAGNNQQAITYYEQGQTMAKATLPNVQATTDFLNNINAKIKALQAK
jgi:hypothetical protein